jgi:glycosyltransferase involved in cell wall biosynthesis
MKIVLNAIQYKRNSSGIGYLAYHWFLNVVRQKKETDTIDIILSKDSPEFLNQETSGIMELRSRFNKNQVIKRNLFELLPPKGSGKTPGVFVSIDSKIPFFMPKKMKKVQIITDLATYRMGWVYQISRAFYWRIMLKRSIRIADRVVAISQFTKDEIVDILHTDPEKIEVIYCAACDDYSRTENRDLWSKVRETYELYDPYILFVGNFNPRKNLERTIKAFDLLKTQHGSKHKLVIVGENGWKFSREAALKGITSIEDVRFIDYVDNKDLSVIYSMADLFVFATLYEGFGIPMIESQKCGTPVLTSKGACFEEVAGKGAYYVDPYCENDICEGIHRILVDQKLKEELIKEGYLNAERFSWEQSAEKLYQVIETVFKENHNKGERTTCI